MIHHLSFPYGDSINTFIPSEFSTVKYATVDDAINFIKFLGRGCVLAKTDVRSAVRIIPVHPSEYPLLGLQWRGNGIMIVVFPWIVLAHLKLLEV